MSTLTAGYLEFGQTARPYLYFPALFSPTLANTKAIVFNGGARLKGGLSLSYEGYNPSSGGGSACILLMPVKLNFAKPELVAREQGGKISYVLRVKLTPTDPTSSEIDSSLATWGSMYNSHNSTALIHAGSEVNGTAPVFLSTSTSTMLLGGTTVVKLKANKTGASWLKNITQLNNEQRVPWLIKFNTSQFKGKTTASDNLQGTIYEKTLLVLSREAAAECEGISIDDATATTVSLKPYLRYQCFTAGKFNVFVDGGINFGLTSAKDMKPAMDLGLFVSPGISYDVNDKWCIAAHLNDMLAIGYHKDQVPDVDGAPDPNTSIKANLSTGGFTSGSLSFSVYYKF